MQHGERRGEDQGQGGSSCRMCPPGLPLRAVSSRAAWPGLRRPGVARGSGFCLFRGAWPPCLPGSVTAVSPHGPVRFGSRLARSLHLLPLAVLQPVQNDAVSGPLPPFAPGRDTEQGAGRRMESAPGGRGGGRKGSDGYIPRHLPPGGCAGRRCQLHPRTRREAASALPRPQFLARLCRSGRPSPRQCVGTPVLSLSCEPKLCKLSGIGAFPKEKQIVTNALGARASFSQPELSASFPGLLDPNAALPKPARAPKAPSSTPCLLPPLSSFP